MKTILIIGTFALLAACSPSGCSQDTAPIKSSEAPAQAAPVNMNAPAGEYRLDKYHATLIFSVNHLGFSNYTSRFTAFDATLNIDPANLTSAQISATIDANSLALENPPPGFLDELRGPNWLDTAKYPEITFKSTQVVLTGADTADVTGDFTLHGVTKPVTLHVKFNGGYPGHAMDPNARIGFSAHGVFKRSDFGIAYGVPEPGSTMGVSDEVKVQIEAEFSGPPLQAAAQ